MAVVYLIRHGQASLHSENYDQLSAKGEQQSRTLGEALRRRGIGFDAVFTGAMERHRQTAERCWVGMQLPPLEPTVLPGWNEYDHETVLHRHRPEFADRTHFARWLASHDNPNRAFQIEFERAMLRWQSGEHDPDYTETWTHFKARCQDAMHQVRCSGAKSIAVFTSGGPISTVTGGCLGTGDQHIAELSWSIVNASITSFKFNAKKLSLYTFNNFSHFEDGHPSLLTFR